MKGPGKPLILVFLNLALALWGQSAGAQDGNRAHILEILKQFQEGYTQRDVSRAKDWVSRLMTEDVWVIGTNAVYPDTGEWQQGQDKAAELFASDWKRWGVLKMEIENARITLLTQNTATIGVTATVTKSPENGFGRSNEANMERCLQRLSGLMDAPDTSMRLKLYTAIWDAGMVLKHTSLGDTFVWPIRISMVLVKQGVDWKISQTHFSYPMAGYPPIRLVDGKIVAY